jgi:hypothetical protein
VTGAFQALQNLCIWSLFGNAQPVSGDIIGVVRVGISDFFVAEIRHFAIKKSPKQHGQGNFLKKI